MFSPSAFGSNLLQGNGDKTTDGQGDETNAAVLSILEELAKYEVPQSLTNMNPERPLLRLDHGEISRRAGIALFDKNSKF